MLDQRLKEHMLQYLDSAVALLIAEERNVSPLDGLRLFLNSKTYEMLCDDSLEMWEFSAAALFDMWQNEIATGDPTNSLYLRGDEIE